MRQQTAQKSLFSPKEAAVLKYMFERFRIAPLESAMDVNEISFGSTLRDSEETLRALYTLEGKSLVQPDPPGDLTSSRWKITDLGKHAVGVLLPE